MLSKKITSLQHPIVKHLVKLKKSKEIREETRSVLISGKKMIQEVSKHLPVQLLLLEKEADSLRSIESEEKIFVTHEILKKITGLDAPEGLAAVVPLPPPAHLKNKKRILALSGIADPGNMGTLLRTALALRWEGAFISEDCVDPFNEKALRASKGAVFRLPLKIGSEKEFKDFVETNKMTAYIADRRGSPLDRLDLPAAFVLILGNESHGVSDIWKKQCEMISIPMSDQMESLNVAIAGGILMYEMNRPKMNMSL